MNERRGVEPHGARLDAARRHAGCRGGALTAAFVLTLASALAPTLVPSPAHANIWNVFGAGSRNIAMGDATVATESNWASVQVNPAGIAWEDDASTTLGLFAGLPRLRVQYRGQREHIHNAFPGRDKDLEDWYGPLIGIVLPAQKLTDRKLDFPWAVALGAYMPGESVFVERATRPDKLFSVDYQERPLGVGLAVAFGIRLHPTLAAGVGATVAVSVPTLANSSGTLDGQQFTSTDVDTRVSPSLTAGIQWKPTDRISIGASYVQEQALSVRGRANVSFAIAAGYPFIPPVPIPGLGPFETEIRFLTTYVPALVTFGAAYRATEQLRVEAALQWQRWETYRTTTAVKPPNEFDNVWSPRVGVEYHLTPNFALRAGFKYEPTPVTEQPQGFNLLGADKYTPSVGFGWTFKDPWGVFSKPMSLDFAAFYQYLKKRSFDEGTGPPPFDLLAPADLLALILLVPNFQGATDVDEPHTFGGRVIGFTMSLTTYF